MTKSQLTSAIATAAAVLATVEAQMNLLTAVLSPEGAKWLRVVVIVGGVIVTAFNQSLSRAHVSIPVEEAKAAGVAPEQTKGQ